IVWTNTATGERYVWYMDGMTNTGGASLGSVPVHWVIDGVADMNADGKVDLVWTNTATGQRYVWTMDGTTNTGGASLGTVGVHWEIVGARDMTGDGKPDLIWQNTLSGQRYVWYMDGIDNTGGMVLTENSTEWDIGAVSIDPPGSGPAVEVTTTSLANGVVGVAYNQTLAASGGTGTFTWSIVGGSLPAGLGLDASTGAITGTPTTAGTADFTVSATSGSQSDTQALSITILAPVAVTTTTLPGGRQATAYAQVLAATGGTGAFTWSVTAGALPGGLSLEPSLGEILGTPTATGTFNFTVQAASGGLTDTQALSIQICPATLALTAGQTAEQVFPTECSVALAPTAGSFIVGVMARKATDGVAVVPGGVRLAATGSAAPGSPPPPPPAGQVPGLPLDVVELAERTEALHYRLREEEINAVPNAPGARPSISGPDLGTVTEPAEPAMNRTFRISDSSAPEGYFEFTATLRRTSASAYYYQDDGVVAEGSQATEQEITDLLDYYEAHGRAIIDDAFGGLGPSGTTNNFTDGSGNVLTLPMNDLDQNGGRFIVLQLRPSKMLAGAAAYVSSCDRFPRPEHYNAGPFVCGASNEGEITYYSRPNSSFYLGTLVHEVKHISSLGYATLGNRGYNPSWIEEGTAEIAKEKSSRDATGLADGARANLATIYPGNVLTANTYGMAVVTSRSRSFLRASPISGIIGNPSPNPDGSTFYGASWLFHRFLVDAYGGGNEDAFMHTLNVGGSGQARIEAVTGRSLSDLMSEFLAAVGVNGQPGESALAKRYLSYDHANIASGFSGGPWPYLQATSSFSNGAWTLPTTYTAPNFFRFNGDGTSTLELLLTNSGSQPLTASDDVILRIIRIN
ncbi:MAG: putative Ig domain-containing protein, partial [Longimicrobiales bacterium]